MASTPLKGIKEKLPLQTKFEKIDNRLKITVEGKAYNSSELARFLGLVPATIQSAFGRNRTPYTRTLWIMKKLWLKEHKLSSAIAVYYSEGFYITVAEIVKAGNVTMPTAMSRGRAFEMGYIDKHELLRRSNRKKKAFGSHKADWKGLKPCGHPDNVKRLSSIHQLPGPTKFDKEVKDVYTGGPQLMNMASDDNGRR